MLHDRILIGDVLKNAGVLEHFESIVKDAVSARTQRDPSQHSCPSQVEYDRKVNEFEAELMALARKDNDLESTQAQTEPAHAAVGRNDKAQEPGKEETEEPAKEIRVQGLKNGKTQPPAQALTSTDRANSSGKRWDIFISHASEDKEVIAHPLAEALKSTRFRRVVVTGVAIMVIGLAVGGWLFHSRKAHGLTDKDTIVISDFDNKTGDPIFDDTLKAALNVSLRQSPFLNVLSDSEVTATLQLMTRPASTNLTPEVARELCQRAGRRFI